MAKLRLASEVLRTYPVARRQLKRPDQRAAVAHLREWGASRERKPRPSADEALRLGRAVSRTLEALPLDSRCLIQSLVLTTMLARRGVTGIVVIGVRPGSDFGAHAWVELDGRPLLLPGEREFGRLVEI